MGEQLRPAWAGGPRAAPAPDAIRAVPVRHPGRMVAGVVVVLVASAALLQMATNRRFQWDVVGQYLTAQQILEGLGRTVELTALSMAGGIVLGIVLAVMRLSPNRLLSSASWFYTWFFRGTPLLVQIIFWFNLAALYPDISLGIPFGPQFVHLNANAVVTPFMAAVLGLGLNEGAYMAEIVRAGILSVEPGQAEAAQALGMTRLQTVRRIVLPQAMRTIIPPTGNQVISMLKTTSLVSVIALPELLYSAQIIYSRTYQTIPLLIVASIWYLIVTSVLTVVQHYVERHFRR
jgi:polar amino acid transport system permease protein